MTTSARPNAKRSPTSGAATMYTTICTSPFRRIFPRMTAGRSPVSRPARMVVPSVGRWLRIITSYAKNDAAPSTNAIPVTNTKKNMFVVLGRKIAPGPTPGVGPRRGPPMRACLGGGERPKNNVVGPPAGAPATPAMMMAIEWRNAGSLNGKAFTPRTFVSMIPLPIVSAIAFVMKTIPTKFPNAAMATAFVGVRTFVATIVAIAFAASWNPLKKSNEKTTRIATMMIAERSAMPSPCLRASLRPAARDPDGSLILRHNVAQHIGDILAVVRGLLEDLRDLLELDDRHGILLTEERRDRVVHEVVGDVLEAVDLDGDPFDPIGLLHVADQPDRILQ